jgi:hypothetical protein
MSGDVSTTTERYRLDVSANIGKTNRRGGVARERCLARAVQLLQGTLIGASEVAVPAQAGGPAFVGMGASVYLSSERFIRFCCIRVCSTESHNLKIWLSGAARCGAYAIWIRRL